MPQMMPMNWIFFFFFLFLFLNIFFTMNSCLLNYNNLSNSIVELKISSPNYKW